MRSDWPQILGAPALGKIAADSGYRDERKQEPIAIRANLILASTATTDQGASDQLRAISTSSQPVSLRTTASRPKLSLQSRPSPVSSRRQSSPMTPGWRGAPAKPVCSMAQSHRVPLSRLQRGEQVVRQNGFSSSGSGGTGGVDSADGGAKNAVMVEFWAGLRTRPAESGQPPLDLLQRGIGPCASGAVLEAVSAPTVLAAM